MEAKWTRVLKWISLICVVYISFCKGNTGVDIGLDCKNDAECRAGNGGEYSKCHKLKSKCICTMTLLGEDKCKYRHVNTSRACTRRRLYKEQMLACGLECSAKDLWIWSGDMDWYGEFEENFSSLFISDKKTSICYDPKRALHSLPGGFVVKNSTIPGAGLGLFTEVYIQRDTVIGPYKGILDYKGGSGYSWKIQKDTVNLETMWVDAEEEYLSNWLRYANMPTSAQMENLLPLQFKGQMYYLAFRSIHPGTELFVWYGKEYADRLKIKPYVHPNYNYAKDGYAGGSCNGVKEGTPCKHDKNTICVYGRCLCVSGTTLRSGFCVRDETLGGKCTEVDGKTCQADKYTECQRGVCICKNNTSFVFGKCIPDEMVNGRCSGHDGKTCLLDSNAECSNGLCYCKYGTSQVGRKCGKDGKLQGLCVDGRCNGQNVVCNTRSNECLCKRGYNSKNKRCVKAK